jgi:outer membrane receptor for ferrienterochelin and colicins
MNDRRVRTPGRMVLLAAALVAAAGAGPAAANDGALRVTVRDSYGVIPDATVRVARPEGGTARRAQTDDAGVADFPGLAPGTYDVRASFSGFADSEDRGIVLVSGQTLEMELTLAIAQLLTTVTVETPNRREQLLLDVAEPTTLIDRAQIQDTGARSAKDVLVEQSGSGIQVAAGGGQGHLSLNGIPNSGVLVLVNGRRFLGKDANGNLNIEEIQIPGVERIEVVKGAGSALYGSDALGGVVNFITRHPTERGATNAVTLSGGKYSDFRLDDTLTWRGERGGVSLTGGYRTYDGYDLDAENPQTIGQPPATYWNASTSMDVELGPRAIARFFGDYQDRDVRNYFFSGATQLPSTVYDSRRQLTRYTLSPELDILVSSRTSLNATYNYGRYERDETRVFAEDGRVDPQDPWRETNQELKLTGRHGWQAFGREHPLQGGYEYRKEALSRGSLSVEDPDRSVNVVWAQQALALTERLTLTGGVRYDRYSDFGSEWSPKAEVVLTAAEGHRLRGSYGHGFRPPYFGELYLDLAPFFVGNPDLVPEVSDGFTAGYVYGGERAQLSADYYYTKVKNGITFAMLPTGQFTYDNVRRYDSRGVNLSGSVSLPGGLTPSASYTYNKREDDEGEELGGYPRHAAFLKLLWANPRLGLRANLRGQINGEVPPGPDGTFTPSYDVWYAQVEKRFARMGAYALSVYAQVDNLFDQKDVFLQDEGGNPIEGEFQFWLPPRTFQVGVSVDMDWTR